MADLQVLEWDEGKMRIFSKFTRIWYHKLPVLLTHCFVLSGPHRMRKKMCRNELFYFHYPFDFKLEKSQVQITELMPQKMCVGLCIVQCACCFFGLEGGLLVS